MTDTRSTSHLVGEDLAVEIEPWGRIFVRNKRPRDVESFGPERIAIFQHGATYGSTAFDLPFAGQSWMDYVAARGFDTYCLDLPGYGRSARPPAMDQPPEQSPPFMRTPDAAQCLGAVVDFVCRRRGVDRLSLVGWSWGTAITASYTEHNPGRVGRLALFAPVWSRRPDDASPVHVAGTVGAYRTIDRAASLKRRQAGLTEAQKASVMPAEWFEAWWQATLAADPTGPATGCVRAPNGVVLDSMEYWSAGRPLYDPAAITVPVLLAVGEWDNDTKPYLAQELFPLFTAAPWKRLAVLSGGTHTLLMERNRMLLYRTVQQFLEEPPPGAEALA